MAIARTQAYRDCGLHVDLAAVPYPRGRVDDVLLKPFNGTALGALVAIAGIPYFTFSTAQLLSPEPASVLFLSILMPAF